MDSMMKHMKREHSFHPNRSWKRRYFRDLKKLFF